MRSSLVRIGAAFVGERDALIGQGNDQQTEQAHLSVRLHFADYIPERFK